MVKPDINSGEVHPQRGHHNGHPMDGVLVHSGPHQGLGLGLGSKHLDPSALTSVQ